MSDLLERATEFVLRADDADLAPDKTTDYWKDRAREGERLVGELVNGFDALRMELSPPDCQRVYRIFGWAADRGPWLWDQTQAENRRAL